MTFRIHHAAAALTLASVLAFACSCAGRQGGVSSAGAERSHKTQPGAPPPEVTGDVTLAFTGTFGSREDVRSPWGISFGVDGTLYVCDRDRSAVVRLTRDGTLMSRYSGFGSRTERLYSPVDVCSSAGMAVYAIDAANSSVLRFDRNLRHAFPIFTKDAPGTEHFGAFNGLAFDTVSGDLYVSDRDTGAVIRVDLLGKTIRSRGAFGSDRVSLREPSGLDVGEDGTIFIADRGGGVIGVLGHFGARMTVAGKGVLEAPSDVAVLPDGALAVADKRGVIVMSGEGTPLGRAGYGEDRAMRPRSVAFSEGRLYISDAESSAILVYAVRRSGR